jgi:multiple sugar transport system permease protein
MVWRWILDGQWGILNYVLTGLGITGAPVDWLSSGPFLWPALLMVDAWAGFPFLFVNLLAALQGIAPELFEAARIDGAARGRCSGASRCRCSAPFSRRCC